MPSLPVATDQMGNATGLPTNQPSNPLPDNSAIQRFVDSFSKAGNRLLGLNGEERYQLWPERVVREGISAPHDVMSSKVPLTSQDLIAPAMSVAALAGTGGLAGAGEEAGAATLGSAPFLRPALKYEGKLYKGPVGGEHYDAIPKELHGTFQKQAMSGEDLSNFNFGFVNHKGHFLSREDALKYAIDEGLIHPNSEAARAGTLTSTMQLMADSSKPGTAIEALKGKLEDLPTIPMGDRYTGMKNLGLNVADGISLRLPKNLDNKLKNAPIQEFEPNSLYYSQNYLNKDKVSTFLDNPDLIDKSPLTVLKQGDKYILTDGTHRSAAASLLGQSIKAKVINARELNSKELNKMTPTQRKRYFEEVGAQ